MFTKTTFDKKYKNTGINYFMKNYFRGGLYLLVIFWMIFVYDISNVQGTSKHAGLGAFVMIIASPILVVLGFLISHVFYIALFVFIDSIFLKIYGEERKFISSILLSTLVMVLIFELIWWMEFYTENSLFIRTFSWNVVILFFPFIPIFYALILHKKKQYGC